MCNHLAYVYDQGVVFHDPLDGVEVRWHHAQRGKTRLPFGHYKIEVHPPGVNAREVFWPLPPGTVNREELGKFIAPCLIHMLDAFFSGLVVKGLHARGIGDVVAVHDGWFVPETFQAEPGGPVLDGKDALEPVIQAAGADWLEGLGGIYDRLIHYLGDDPTFGAFVHGMKDRWAKRVQAGRWPSFTTG